MNVDALQPGQELDKLIHSKIFDGKIEHRWIRWDENLYQTCLWCGGQFRADQGKAPIGCAVIPPYSRDIAAASEVVERLRTQGRSFMINDNSFNGEWLACFEIRKDLELTPRPFLAHLGKTPMEAICKAALKVVAT